MASGDRKLIEIFSSLSGPDQATLLAFAEFLGQRDKSAGAAVSVPIVIEIAEPEDIPRPGEERVVAAVKRLTRTYPMLSKNKMLGETSDLMTGHVMHGREASEVIDDLESLFKREYELLKENGGDS